MPTAPAKEPNTASISPDPASPSATDSAVATGATNATSGIAKDNAVLNDSFSFVTEGCAMSNRCAACPATSSLLLAALAMTSPACAIR
jgi:hypothetical protein